MENAEIYKFTYEDANLLDALETVSNEIMKIYHIFMEKEISKEFSDIDDEIEKLKKLKEKEEKLYKQVEQKEKCAEAFFTIICNKNKLDAKDKNNYFHIEKFCFNKQNTCFRMKNILHDMILRNTYKMVTDKLIEKYFDKDSGMINALVANTNIDKANYALELSIYIDIYNTYLHKLSIEIDKSINTTIREDLIQAKYNILSTNPILEETYIKESFHIPDTTYLFHGVALDFYSFPNFVKQDFCKMMFNYIVENKTTTALLLGERPYNSSNYKNMLVNILFVDTILKVCDVDSFKDTVQQILDKPYQENNIAKFLIKDIIDENKKDNKVLYMRLGK